MNGTIQAAVSQSQDAKRACQLPILPEPTLPLCSTSLRDHQQLDDLNIFYSVKGLTENAQAEYKPFSLIDNSSHNLKATRNSYDDQVPHQEKSISGSALPLRKRKYEFEAPFIA